MKMPWRTILLRVGILTTGFAVVISTIAFVGFEDARMTVIFGTAVMAVALIAATLLSSGQASDKNTDKDLSGRPKG